MSNIQCPISGPHVQQSSLRHSSAHVHHKTPSQKNRIHPVTTVSKQAAPSPLSLLAPSKDSTIGRDFCTLSWRSGATHCAPGSESPLSINQLACVVFFERSAGRSQILEDSGGFKFSMTCQEYSNSFVRESHSVHVLQGLQFRYPGVTQETREWTLPVVWSTWERAFTLRAVPIILLGQFDVFVSPHFVTAPCHRFFPASATFRITRAAHHLPSSNTHTSHRQSLHAWLIVFLELSGHNDASTFHVISPALVRSPAQAQDSTRLSQFPNTQSLEH